jgi:hypothetical protein
LLVGGLLTVIYSTGKEKEWHNPHREPNDEEDIIDPFISN